MGAEYEIEPSPISTLRWQGIWLPKEPPYPANETLATRLTGSTGSGAGATAS
jgi:hypothetical protein